MTFPDLAFAMLITFTCSLSLIPYWISRCRQHKLLATDVQKYPPKKIPALGSLPVILSSIIGMLFVIATQTFLVGNDQSNTLLLAGITTILIALIIGLIDDLLGEKIGLRKYQKLILTTLCALPLAVVNAGTHTMTFPLVGTVILGNIYPFLVIPIGVVGATNGFNILAGINGLETGNGIIILLTLGLLSYHNANMASVIALCTAASLLPLFWYNKYPARILCGNGFTYATGACIAVVAILSDLERPAVILFIPYFLELILKLRGRMQNESLATPQKDGSLKNKYSSWYSLNHVIISLLRTVNKRAYEWQVALILLLFQLFFAAIALAISLY